MNRKIYRKYIKYFIVIVTILWLFSLYSNSGHESNTRGYDWRIASLYDKENYFNADIDCASDEENMFRNSSSICSQQQRKDYMRKMCKLHGNPGSGHIKTKFHVDTINKVAWHEVAKAGSTAVKTLMVRVASGNLTQVFPDVHSTDVTDLYMGIGIQVIEYTPYEVETYLKGYTKFIVVRNPLARISSAYTDKIVFYEKYFNNEYAEFKTYLEEIQSPEATWPIPAIDRFIEMLVSKSKASLNLHWYSYFKAANPCYIDYDYVLKIETLDIDLPMFVKEVYKSKYTIHNDDTLLNLNVRDKKISLRKNLLLDKVIQGLMVANQTLLEKVRDTFCYDAKFFGYGYSIKTSMAHCWLPEHQCC